LQVATVEGFCCIEHFERDQRLGLQVFGAQDGSEAARAQ
jgi:hypothetical protein